MPCGTVQSLLELTRDPQLHASGMLGEYDHPEFGHLVLSHSPLVYRDHPRAPYQISGPLGRDNAGVFGEIGLTEADLARLREAGII